MTHKTTGSGSSNVRKLTKYHEDQIKTQTPEPKTSTSEVKTSGKPSQTKGTDKTSGEVDQTGFSSVSDKKVSEKLSESGGLDRVQQETSKKPLERSRPNKKTTTTTTNQSKTSTGKTGAKQPTLPKLTGTVVSTTGDSSPSRVNTLVSELKLSPSARVHLEALEAKGLKIELVTGDTKMKTGAYFSPPHNVIRVSDKLTDSQIKDQILFESGNALHRQQYQDMDSGMKNGTMTLSEYGKTKATTEFHATMKYAELLISDKSPGERKALSEAILTGQPLPNWANSLPELARGQLVWAEKTAPGYLETLDKTKLPGLLQSFLTSPHKETASPLTSQKLTTPNLYSYEELERKTPGGLRNMLIEKFFPTTTEINKMPKSEQDIVNGRKSAFRAICEQNLPSSLLKLDTEQGYTPKNAKRISDGVEVDLQGPSQVHAFTQTLEALQQRFPDLSRDLGLLKPPPSVMQFVNNAMKDYRAYQQNPGAYQDITPKG